MKKYIYILISFILLNINVEAQTPNNSRHLWDIMMDSCDSYKEKQEYEIALKWAKLALPEAEKEFGKLDTNYAFSLANLYQIYYSVKQYDSSVYYGEKALALDRKIYNEDRPEILDNINWLGYIYVSLGKFSEAETMLKESLTINRKQHQGDNPDLAFSICNLGNFYNRIGKYDDAEPLLKEGLFMYKHLYKEDNADLAAIINNSGVFYKERGNYSKAEPLLIEALEMRKRLFKGDNPDLAMSLNSVGMLYTDFGDYSKAEPLLKDALGMYRRLYKGDHPVLALSINNLAYFYNERGDYSEEEPLLKESLQMCRRLYKGNHPDLAMLLNNIAIFYNKIGNYRDAEKYLMEALDMRNRLFQKDHPDLALSINNLAFFYEVRGNYTAAEPLFKKAIQMYRRIFKGDESSLANSLNNLGMLYCYTAKTDTAEILLKESLEMYKHIYKGDQIHLARTMNNLASIYLTTGTYPDAESLLKNALAMYRRLFKIENAEIEKCIVNLATLYYSIGNFSDAEHLYLEGIQVNENILNNYFPSLSEKEKEQFWATVSDNFEALNSFAITRIKDNPSITGKLYDIQLYTKALLFNSSSRIRSRVMDSKDSILISDYKHWLDLKEYLLKCWSKTSGELEKKGIKIDSLENLANDYEKSISKKSELYAKNYEKKKISWKSLPTVLQPGEAAIEIIRFRLRKGNRFTDTVYYAALIVTEQTTDYPDIVIMENGNDLENKCYAGYMKCMRSMVKDTDSFNDYWAKIYEKIKGLKRIYLSCDGVYNKINPETFLMPDGKYIKEVQEIFQVNSTKDLISGIFQKQQETNIYNSAELFGNPTFDLPLSTLKEKEKKYEMASAITEQNAQSGGDRGLILKALPGTEKEVSDIDNYLKSKNWVVKTYLKDEAIKAAIKSIHSPRVLHIATHGLFLADVNRDSGMTLGIETKKMVENPLLRSGLFFAGASNNAEFDKFNPTGEDNGFLTAYEAMNLDLENTELVVLSACETGLGEIRNGEGVFGLRRAFQQAGAKSIIMTLWKVFDTPTQEMMSRFYANWVSGMTKREAFSKAQQDLRVKYKDPYYWGAFVMVGE